MIGHEIPLWIVLPQLAVLGLFVGRFLNICIERFPVDVSLGDQLKSLRKPWSVCRICAAPPTAVEKIPITGWLASERRCCSCNARVPINFTAIELLTAALFVLVYWWEIPVGAAAKLTDSGLTTNEGLNGPEVITKLWQPLVWLHLRYALHMLMICGLIVATEIDRKLRLIPDGSTVPIMLFAFAASFAFGQLFVVPIWFQDASTVRILQPMMPEFLQPFFVPWDPANFIQQWPHLHGLLVSVVGAVAGAGSVWIVRQIGFLVLKQEAMGFGDVVLMGMIGSVIGWQPVLAVFMFAPMLAITAAIVNFVAHRDNEIPYGPFLSAATVMLLLTWPYSWPLAKRFFDLGPVLLLLGVLMVFLMAASLQLVQIVKRLLGFGPPVDEEDGNWSSADHLTYYNSERPDEQTGAWQTPQWPGSRAGRGLKSYNDWRNGS